MASGKVPPPSIRALFSRIKKGDLLPCYVLWGEETFLIRQAIAALKKTVVPDGDDLAYVSLQGDDTTGAAIVGTSRTVPMLSERQLVVVRNGDALSKDDLKALLPYLEAPSPSTCLVIAVTKLDRRFKFFDQVAKRGWAYCAEPLKPRDGPSWIARRAQARGLKLSPRAAQVLADTTGTDLAQIDDALERLALFVGEGRETTVEDIDEVVTSSRMRSVFELTDALGKRDLAGAMRTLSNVLEQGDPPLRLLATLATHIRRLLLAADFGRAALDNPDRLAGPLGVPPFIARKLAAQAKHFSRRELRQAFERCGQTDLELKMARRSDRLVLEQMVLEMCAPPQQAL